MIKKLTEEEKQKLEFERQIEKEQQPKLDFIESLDYNHNNIGSFIS